MQPAQGTLLRSTVWCSPIGSHLPGRSRAENSATHGTLHAAARCIVPVSLPTNSPHRSSSAADFGTVTLAADPQLYLALEPAAPGDTLAKLSPATPLQPQDPAKPFEITIAPGEIIPAWIKIKRNGANGDLRFDVENLPHGIIVDNLGLNGITLLAGQNEGEIALKAEPWVAEQDRLCFGIARDAGKQSSLPVMLHVRKREGVKAITVK